MNHDTNMAAAASGRESGRPVQLGRDTLLPLGMVLGILLGVVGFYSWLDARFDGLAENNNGRFTEITVALHGMDERLRVLEIQQHHRWDSLDMKEWMLELKRLNPSLRVPAVPVREANADVAADRLAPPFD